MTVKAFDSLLGKWFAAKTQDLLLALMNGPRFVNLRNATKARRELERGLNERHGMEQRIKADFKRTRKGIRRRLNVLRGGYVYAYTPNRITVPLFDMEHQAA